MKKFSLLLILLLSTATFAQKYEIGAFVGNTNYIGDVGSGNYIGLKGPSLGLLAKYNLNPRQSLRLNINYGEFRAKDENSTTDYRLERDFSVTRNIGEISGMYEVSFFEFSNQKRGAGTPYMFAGLGLLAYTSPIYNIMHTFNRDANGTVLAPTTKEDFKTTIQKKRELAMGIAIPFGIGYKYKIKNNWILAAEIGVRYTSTDNLDASKLPQKDINIVIENGLNTIPQSDIIKERNQEIFKTTQYGDPTNNDWYVFTGFTLSYTFGREPCYCK